MPKHHLLSAVRGTLLFNTHAEARALWERLFERLAEPLAVCLMPDHVHVLHRRDQRAALGDAARAYARWRNAFRGESGPVFRRQPAVESVADGLKTRRSVRYIHLNPCRGGLVTCPLAWPWSTHRDRTGLVLAPRAPRASDIEGFHRYVSGDPSAEVLGTPLPVGGRELPVGRDGLEQARAAVSEALRVPFAVMERRGPARTLLVHALRAMTDQDAVVIGGLTGMSPRSVRRVSTRLHRDLRLVGRLCGDARFPGLGDHDLRLARPFGAYARRKGVPSSRRWP